jgi:serine/threonine protein kinase
MIGRTLDRYMIESQLGHGGMGVVYKARDAHLDRTVAIKILPPDKVADPARRQRFVHEAKAASALNHPGIVTIHDIRSEQGIDFIVMEYVRGKTLEQTIPSKGLPVTTVRYAIQIADALASAHGAGIIHRDLKPSNVMVLEDGRIKILDFGLAKLVEPEDSSDAITRTASLTGEGLVVGTAAYMSPEQAEGRRLDARSDIFSFGSVLYEMLTGTQPFTGDSRLSVLARIVGEDPTPPTRLGAAIPAELEKIVLRCLRKDPARRFQTMADLKAALEDLEEELRSGAQAERRLHRRWIGAAVLPALLIAGLIAWRASRAPTGTEPLQAVPLTTLPGVQRYPSFSPDGDHVVFTWTGPKQDNTDIYRQQIGAGSPLRLTTDPGNDYNPVWSPDGRAIAFLRGEPARSEVRLIPPLSGPASGSTSLRTERERIGYGRCPRPAGPRSR